MCDKGDGWYFLANHTTCSIWDPNSHTQDPDYATQDQQCLPKASNCSTKVFYCPNQALHCPTQLPTIPPRLRTVPHRSSNTPPRLSIVQHSSPLPHPGSQLFHTGLWLPYQGSPLSHPATRLSQLGFHLLYPGFLLSHAGSPLSHTGFQLLHPGLSHTGSWLSCLGSYLHRYMCIYILAHAIFSNKLWALLPFSINKKFHSFFQQCSVFLYVSPIVWATLILFLVSWRKTQYHNFPQKIWTALCLLH